MFQELINQLYRYPKSNWKTIQRFGGYISYQKMLSAQKQMQKYSAKLPPILSHHDGLPIYFLTGKSHLYQTLFCAYSLSKVTTEKIQFTLVDDGSFDDGLIHQAKQQMPNVRLVLKDEIEKNLEYLLPINEYPYLHHKRKVYPHIKKLTDIHTIDPNTFKLVLDSDMLFWDEPITILNWLKKPDGCVYMLDCEESYGYDKDLMKSLCGFEIPKMMNVGAFGFNSAILNWKNIENWSHSLENQQGASYFLEQALSAMLIANEEKTILDKAEYIVNPNDDNFGTLTHYVDLSKKRYYTSDWKYFAKAKKPFNKK